MKTIKKRVLIILMACVMAVFVSACGKGDGKGNGTTDDTVAVEFWSTYATEKVMQNRTDLYDGVKFDAKVAVEACKGEYESTQLIMNPSGNITAYDANIEADLSGPDGAKFSKDNISIYVEKYVTVSTVFSGAHPAGKYPDALVPIDISGKAGENVIKSGENQGLYITFNVPKDQAPGTYSGSLKVTYNGQVKVLPISLTVFDFLVSPKTRSKSYFNLGFTQYLGELDSSDEMWRAYAEKLIEYRIAPSSVLSGDYLSGDYRAAYVNEAVELVLNYGMSTINLPAKSGTGMTDYIVDLAKKSIEHNYNFIDHVMVKGPDEPNPNDASAMKDLLSYSEAFWSGRAVAVKKIDDLAEANPNKAAFITELAQSAAVIPSVIALYHGGRSALLDARIDTYCPLFTQYNTQAGRDSLTEHTTSREKWWYGCESPKPPYPTYHTEDHMLSPRLVGWMMTEYGVGGNLYWSATVYSRYDGNQYNFIEDYHTGSASRWPSNNGDGYLFYPGAKYGVFGPLGSMRLEAIRDGNEEYEILYDLNTAYEKAGVSAGAVQRFISKQLYEGSTILHNPNMSAGFVSSRKSAIQLAAAATSPAQLMLTGITDDTKGGLSFELCAKSDYEVKHNGEKLNATSTANGFNYYIVNLSRSQAVNSLNLSVEAGGKTFDVSLNLGGKVVHYEADALLNSDNSFSGGNAITAAIDNGSLQLTATTVTDAHQFIRYMSSIINSFDANTEKIILHFDAGTTETEFSVLAKHKNAMLNETWYTGTIPAGESRLEINVSALDWSRLGQTEYLGLYLTHNNLGAKPAKTVRISGMTVYSI